MSEHDSRAHAHHSDVSTDRRFLAFSLAKEIYAIPLLQVKEVIGMTEPTPIPNAPPHFKGIINLRGLVISVVDLRAKLKLAKEAPGPETSIIILDLTPPCGMVVDSVESVLAVSAENLSPAPQSANGEAHSSITGVARQDKQLVLLLDIQSVIDRRELKAIRDQQTAA
jgi:purine-binding chemotaxis protein CheW